MEIGWTYSDLDEINDQGELVARGVIVERVLNTQSVIWPAVCDKTCLSCRRRHSYHAARFGRSVDLTNVYRDTRTMIFSCACFRLVFRIYSSNFRCSMAYLRDQQLLFPTNGD